MNPATSQSEAKIRVKPRKKRSGAIGEILYVDAKRNTARIDKGQWLFHTGAANHCGSVCRHSKDSWSFTADWVPAGKTSPEPVMYPTLEKLLQAVSDLYGVPVREVTPREAPVFN